MYVITSRLCEHSNLVKFGKRAAKTPQNGLRYDNIIMLYDILNTYEWFFCYNWHELCSSNKLSDFSIIFCFLDKYAIWISNMNDNELLPHPLLCWYATSGAGGFWSGNQLTLGGAQQYSDIKFLNILRKGLGRTDLFLDFGGDVLCDGPLTHVDKIRLLHSGYSSFSQLICGSSIVFFELCWL